MVAIGIIALIGFSLVAWWIIDGERKGIPTLTILGGLNGGYDGRDLIFWQDTPITLKAGEIMIFPSNFLYPHRVDMVTKGTRYSYVSWTW